MKKVLDAFKMKIEKIVYFDSPGRQNTDETLRLAKERAEALAINDIVIASVTGETGIKACNLFQGFNLVIVRHHTGYKSPGFQEMEETIEKKIIASKAKLVTMSHSLSGVERAIRFKWNSVGPLEIMADILRLFGEGTKVCVEIAVMAADAGLIPIDNDIISIGGTGQGADTAIVLRPVHSNNLFDLTVKEIIAKPRERFPRRNQKMKRILTRPRKRNTYV